MEKQSRTVATQAAPAAGAQSTAGSLKNDLRGLDYESQEAALAPGGAVQRKLAAGTPVQRQDGEGTPKPRAAKTDKATLAKSIPIVINAGTSTTRISSSSAQAMGFKLNTKYSFALTLRTLGDLTHGSKGIERFASGVLTEVGPVAAKKDLLLVGGSSNGFVLDGPVSFGETGWAQFKDGQGAVLMGEASNNGLLALLRLGSALRHGLRQTPEDKQGKNVNVIAQASYVMGQNKDKDNARVEGYMTADSAKNYQHWLTTKQWRTMGVALLRQSGAPESAMVNKGRSDFSSGIGGKGAAGVISGNRDHFLSYPDRFYQSEKLDFSGAIAAASPPGFPGYTSLAIWSQSDGYKGYVDGMADTLVAMYSAYIADIVKGLSVPGEGTVVGKALKAQLKTSLNSYALNKTMLKESLRDMLTNTTEKAAPSKSKSKNKKPVANAADNREDTNVEDLVGRSASY